MSENIAKPIEQTEPTGWEDLEEGSENSADMIIEGLEKGEALENTLKDMYDEGTLSLELLTDLKEKEKELESFDEDGAIIDDYIEKLKEEDDRATTSELNNF